MKLLFENWRRYLSEQDTTGAKSGTKRDLEGQRLLLIGDSQVAGWYGLQLQRKLEKRGAVVLRLGQTSAGARFWNNILQYGKPTLRARKQVYDRSKSKIGWKKMKPVTWKSQINKFKPTSIIIGSLGGNDVSRLQTAESTQRHFKKYVKPMLDKLKKINTNISWSGPAPTGQSPRKVKKRKIAANNLGGAMAEYNNLAKPKEKTGIVKYYNISDMLKTSPNFKPVVYKHRFDKWGKEMPAKSRKYWGDTLHYREEPAKYYAEHVLNLLDIPKQPPIVDTKTPVDTSVPAEKTTNELKEKVLNI